MKFIEVIHFLNTEIIYQREALLISENRRKELEQELYFMNLELMYWRHKQVGKEKRDPNLYEPQ